MTSTYTGRMIYSGVHVVNSLENGKKYAIQISSNVPGDTKKYYLCKEANHDFLHAREVPDAIYPLIEFTATLPSGENRFILSTDANISLPTTACLELGLLGAQREVYLTTNAAIARWVFQGSTNALYGVADNQTVMGQVYYDVANDLVTYTNGTVTSDYPVTLNEVIVPGPSEVTVSHTLSEVGSHYGWSSSGIKDNWYLDYDASTPGVLVTLVATGNNNGLYNGGTYRVNMNEVQITPPTGKKIKAVKFTFTKSGSTVPSRVFLPNGSYKNITTGNELVLDTPVDYIQLAGGRSSNQYITVTAMEITYE